MKNMFNKKLKNRIEELEKENERLELFLHNLSINFPDVIKDNSYADLVKRIIEHIKISEYSPYQERLLSFIVSELTILRDRFKKGN